MVIPRQIDGFQWLAGRWSPHGGSEGRPGACPRGPKSKWSEGSLDPNSFPRVWTWAGHCLNCRQKPKGVRRGRRIPRALWAWDGFGLPSAVKCRVALIPRPTTWLAVVTEQNALLKWEGCSRGPAGQRDPGRSRSRCPGSWGRCQRLDMPRGRHSKQFPPSVQGVDVWASRIPSFPSAYVALMNLPSFSRFPGASRPPDTYFDASVRPKQRGSSSWKWRN